MSTVDVLFLLLRSALTGEPSRLPKEELTAEAPEALYRLAKKHDVAHLVALALEREGLLPEGKLGEALKSQQMLAIYRTETALFAYDEIKAALEEAEIPFIPLKGAILRDYYPEPWMRTSCDIDILVRKEQLNDAVAALQEKGYKASGKLNYHDISLYSPSGVHLELHFSIKENMPQIDPMLESVWDYAEGVEGKKYEKRQSAAYFVFHHIAHMSYHFVSGGCGIKPLLDLFVMRQKMPYEEEKARALCAACGLEDFYGTVLSLTEAWLEGKPHTPLSQKAESYILSGGVYGSSENHAVAKQGVAGGKFKYFWGRLFPPLSFLKETYPVLARHKWLYPVMLVRRLFTYLFTGGLRRGKKEWQANQAVSRDEALQMRAFLEQLGIQVK